jgi:hypothetical protein
MYKRKSLLLLDFLNMTNKQEKVGTFTERRTIIQSIAVVELYILTMTIMVCFDLLSNNNIIASTFH